MFVKEARSCLIKYFSCTRYWYRCLFQQKKIESVEQSDVASYSVTIERTIRFLLLQSLCTKKKQPKKQKRKVKFYVGRRIEGGSLNWVLKKSRSVLSARERERERNLRNGDCDRSSSKKKKKTVSSFVCPSLSYHIV